MKKFLKRAGKAAVNIQTAPIRVKAKLLEKGARAVGAQGVADMAGKIAQPLSKGGMPKRNYKHGGPAGHDGNKHARREYKQGGNVKGTQPEYKSGEMPKCMPK